MENIKNKRFFKGILIAAIILFIIAQTIYYVSCENNIYYWDYAGFYHFWQNFSVQFIHEPFKALKHVFATIRGDDYNYLPVVIPAIFDVLPLSSRASYILSIAIFYYLPTVFLFSYACRRFIGNCQNSIGVWGISLILPATFTAFWAPILNGYPDICGLVFILLAILYQARFDIGDKIQLKRMIILGILLWAPFVLRRWYAYTVVSLYISLPILNYFLFWSKEKIWKRLCINLINFFIAGIISCAFALFFQKGLIHRIIHTDYSDIYSAYQAGIEASVKSVINSCGYYIFPFVILGLIVALLTKNTSKKYFISFCLFNLAFTFFLFTRTQTPGIQHNLPFVLWILFIAYYGIEWLYSYCSTKLSRNIFVVCLTVCVFYIDQHTFFNVGDNNQLLVKLLPSKHPPLTVNHYANYVRLMHDIESLLKQNEKIAVLSSNGVLNDDMLFSLSNKRVNDFINYTSQVDSRDKITFSALLSDYIIVVDPPQTHLGEQNQQVIVIPTNSLLKNQNIGKAFTKVGHAYKLDNNATAYIYKRTRSFTFQEVEDFLKQFYQYYPNWRNIYDEPLFKSFVTADVISKSQWANFDFNSLDNTIYAHPGEDIPVQVTWIMDGFKKMIIQSTNTECNQSDTIIVKIYGNNLSSKILEIPHGGKVLIDIAPWLGKESKMSISKNKSSGCDALKISAQ